MLWWWYNIWCVGNILIFRKEILWRDVDNELRIHKVDILNLLIFKSHKEKNIRWWESKEIRIT